MDFYGLRDQLNKIEMSDEVKNRISKNCRLKLAASTEENAMKKFRFKQPVVAIVAVALCLCLAVGVGAAVGGGMFVDIKDWRGAVTGAEYTQASDEINVSVGSEGDVLAVNVEVLTPDAAPYSAFEQLGIGVYRITDETGAVVAEGESSAAASLAEGKAALTLPFDGIVGEEYTLQISSFVGSAKADQPLVLNGNWEMAFIAE